jgi:uncharacterized secreted protein with C-terminal beta-propeller domain
MRLLSKVALGGSIVSIGTAGALVAAGVFATTATLVVADPFTPAASADSLSRFDSCAALLNWYVDHGVDEVGPYGWAGPIMYAYDDMAVSGLAPPAGVPEVAGDSATKAPARASSGTGTNTQEADVDEPDVAKTDGRRVVRLVDQRTVVVDDVTGTDPHELGRMPLPVDVYGGELLLAGDHVLVSQAGGWVGGRVGWGPAMEGDVARSMPSQGVGTRIIDVDISDPAHARVVHDDTYAGSLVSMRLYGDTVRVVTSTSRPELDWATPREAGPRRLSEDEATRHNRALVRATTIEDWLPSVVDNQSGGASSPLLDCTDIYHPDEWSGGQTTAVTTYDVTDPGHRRSVGVTADGQVVYSSADRLYVTSTRIDPPDTWKQRLGSATGREPMQFRPEDPVTQLHAFALDGAETRYVASGHVTGTVRDRWSLDEHDGRLRVAWTIAGSRTITDTDGVTRQQTRNGITILSERNGTLEPTGTIDGLGLDENIQSVRWFDDLAVLVTFRQMDPLYTIDLTDQDHPREIGKLKIPGYSGYLHPIGDDLLLGLGVDATDQGRSLGSQAAVFDIADLADPKQVSKQRFGVESSLLAIDDPRGFTWLPDRRTGLTTVSIWTTDRTRLVALHVSDAGELVARDLATDVGWNARTLPLDDGRIALVDEHLRLISVD